MPTRWTHLRVGWACGHAAAVHPRGSQMTPPTGIRIETDLRRFIKIARAAIMFLRRVTTSHRSKTFPHVISLHSVLLSLPDYGFRIVSDPRRNSDVVISRSQRYELSHPFCVVLNTILLFCGDRKGAKRAMLLLLLLRLPFRETRTAAETVMRNAMFSGRREKPPGGPGKDWPWGYAASGRNPSSV